MNKTATGLSFTLYYKVKSPHIMEPEAIIVVAVTVVLGVVAALAAVAGIVLWRIERTRSLAPFVTFIPSLAMLGAGVCSWGLGISTASFWLWFVGLPVGGVLGGLLGLRLALWFRSGPTGTQNTTRL
ncbi:MAG: hypothetical protein HY300_11815 [Verrucomicrobia bacterium]|nr:hypothetical protein [Verrucomicrobiota bacterium]